MLRKKIYLLYWKFPSIQPLMSGFYHFIHPSRLKFRGWGMETVHELPWNNEHEYFKNSKYGNMDITNKVVQEVLTIPLHSFMKEEFIQHMIDGITSFFRK